MTAILTFSLLILLALTLVSLVNKLQNRKRIIRLKIQQLKTRVHELEDISLCIASLLESTDVPKLINEEIINLLQSIIQLDPESATLLSLNMKNAENLLNSYARGANPSSMNRIQPSDSAIAKHQYYLTEAGKLIRRHKNLGRIEEVEMQAHIKELAWAHLMVATVSQVAQGHQALKRNELLLAAGHYKGAHALVRNSSITDEKRHRLLRELNELIDGKRLALSTDIMPETAYNPDSNQPQPSAGIAAKDAHADDN